MQSAQDALSEAVVLRRKGDYQQAEAAVQRRLRNNPHDANALHLLGVIARDTGRLNFSAEVLRQAIQLNSDRAEYHFDLALTVNRLDQPELALAHFRRAVDLRPDYQDAVLNVGTLLDRMGLAAEARPWFRRAIDLDPQCPIAHYNLGNACHALGELAAAKDSFARAIELKPDFAKAHWNKSLCHLLAGEFADGWREYSWRERAGEVVIDNYPQPRWNGDSLSGKAILVHAEQGIGDEILFATCLDDLIAQAGRSIVVCEPRLAPLFARTFPRAEVYGHARRKDRAPATVSGVIDFQAPLGDLPRHFRQSLTNFPSPTRYLTPDQLRVAYWRQRLSELGTGPKVGISWSAGGQPHERLKRSTTLDDWRPVLAMRGVHFVNVQYGETARDVAHWNANNSVKIHDFSEADPLVDLDDFAAKLAALDLVISVGNTSVHLAGALGVPAWALLPTVPGWRWLIAGETNPWYSSVRAIRQTRPGDWAGVFAAAAERLREMVTGCTARTERAKNDECELQIANCKMQIGATATPNARLGGSSGVDHHVAARPTGSLLPRFNTEQILEKAFASFRAGDLATAAALFNEVLAHAPRNVAALAALGRIAIEQRRFDVAGRMLARAAAAEPQCAAIWVDLARAQNDAGDQDGAIESYQRLTTIEPQNAHGWSGLADALRAARRYGEAYDAYMRAAARQPTNPKLFNFLGATCLELGRLAEAERALRRAVELCPAYHAAWNNLGCALERRGRRDEAIACFQRAVQFDPQSREAASNLINARSREHVLAIDPAADEAAGDKSAASESTADRAPPTPRPAAGAKFPPLPPALEERLNAAGRLFNDERFDEAEPIAREILAYEPNHPIALRITGVAARRAGRIEGSIAALKRATEIDPKSYALQFELGVAYIECYRHMEAFECFWRCRELRPDFQPACVNLAGILEQQERYEEAMPWAQKAVDLNPNCFMARYNLANNYRECGRLHEAIEQYERAIAINRDYVRAEWNLGICHLHLGNYEQGWPRYENRMAAEEVRIDQYAEPRWNGESLTGKTIVVHAEQGIGDEIVFCSCLPELIAQAGRVIVVCEPRLEALFRRSFPQCKVYGYARRKNWSPCPINERFDYQIPMGSLPLFLRPMRESFPKRERFLTPDPTLVEQWRARFASLGSGLKIGVSWRAGGKPLERRKRSAPLELWMPILGVSGAHFINLQYGDASDDAAEVRKRFGVELNDWEQGDPLVDLDSFAAKVAALDLVISVGNATVHIAGAVGTPAWTILPMIPSWRWMVAGDTSPWYTSVRLFRQPGRGEWRPVLDRLGKMLAELAAAPPVEIRRRANDVDASCVLDNAQQPLHADEQWLDSSQFCVKSTIEAVPELLKQAEDFLAQGELAGAEAIYRQILAIAPRFAAALHGLSRVARRMGNSELAIRSLKRALATPENVAVRRCDLAAVLADAGRHEEAIESYLRAIEVDPQLYQAHFEFGLLLARLGRHEEAAARFQRASAIDPSTAATLIARGRSLVVLCRADEAIACLERALAIEPRSSEALLLLAGIHREDQSFAEAKRCLRSAVELEPQSAPAKWALASLLEQARREDEAVEQYQSALQLDPRNYAALVQLGTLQDSLCQPVEAESSFLQALALQALAPRELVNSLGVALADQGRLDEALECYDLALRAAGDQPYPQAHANRAFALLEQGRFAAGWDEYEWRWQCPGAPSHPVDHLQAPAWDGSSLAGKTILIHGEQGVGDEIMFASCYDDVIAQAARTIITCEPRLERLFRRSLPRATIIAVLRGLAHRWRIPPRLHVDAQVAAGSLPRFLRRSEADFPPRASFLQADAALVAGWRERIAALEPGIKVGISWRAGQKPKQRRLRTTHLAQWAPLLQTPGVQFINLQHGDCETELAGVEQSAGIRLHRWRDGNLGTDLDCLAACIAGLDLVISVGNANVHLAGGLGVPAWSLLPRHGTWRWPAGRCDAPWYTSVRLFRQAARNDWDKLILRIRQELLQRLRAKAEQNTMPVIAAPHWDATGIAVADVYSNQVQLTNDQIPMTN